MSFGSDRLDVSFWAALFRMQPLIQAKNLI